jgi:flagellar assembly protein FliH
MSNQFEPYFKGSATPEFSQWHFGEDNAQREPLIDPEEALANEYEKMKEEARESGYQEGLLQAKEEIQQQKEILQNTLQALLKPQQLLDQALIAEIVTTMIWLCQYCIEIELSVHPEKLQALIERIKTELPSLHGKKILMMHPDDLDWITQNLKEEGLLSMLEANPSFFRGDFLLKSEDAVLDGALSTRLHTIFAEYLPLKESTPEK